MAEVEALDGYHPDNVVSSPDAYAGVVGPYKFDDRVKCRLVKPNGNTCDQAHGEGWVLRLKDGSVAIVGGTCALNHFGLRSGELQRDMNLVTNVLERERAAEKLRQLLETRDSRLAEVDTTLAQVMELKARVAQIQAKLGKLAWRALEDMGRAGDSLVRARGVRKATYDSDGERTRDRVESEIILGSVTGVVIAKPSTIVRAAEALRDLLRTYRRADSLQPNETRSKDYKQVNAALARHARAIQDAAEFLELGRLFEQNDFSILAFLIRDKVERAKLVRAALDMRGSPVSGESAKAWIAQAEAGLRRQHRVDLIEPY